MSPHRVDNVAQAPALDDAMQAFAGISESLVNSYRALADRAQMVEDELGRTNLRLERKLAELDEVHRHLEAVLRSLPTGVVVRDSAGRIARINGAALAILGVDRGEHAGAACARLFDAGGQGGDGDAATLHETERPDGSRLVVSARRSAVRDAGGAEAGSVEILDDRTELVSLSERMHAMDKMAALGTMGGGIAHEIRNPLNAVKGFASLMQRELAGDRGGEDDAERARLARWATRIVEGADEADAIIESLLAIAHPERVKQEPIDPEALVRDAWRAALGESTAIELRTECTAPSFLGDRIKLRQALRNLIANGAQAQEGRGAIRVAVRRADDSILLSVRDEGPGIPAELRRRVLDPFFTTRAEGTGLGLALVATIARLHAGGVRIDSAPTPSTPRTANAGRRGAEITLQIPYQPVPPTTPDEKAS